jgi:hypothetical protein
MSTAQHEPSYTAAAIPAVTTRTWSGLSRDATISRM